MLQIGLFHVTASKAGLMYRHNQCYRKPTTKN